MRMSRRDYRAHAPRRKWDQPSASVQKFQDHDEERQDHERQEKPSKDHPPPAPQRGTGSITTGQTDRPHLDATFGEDTTVAANRFATLSTRANRLGCTVFATGIGATSATFGQHESTGHAKKTSACADANVIFRATTPRRGTSHNP